MRRPEPGRLLTAGAGVLAVIGAALPFYSFPGGATATVWSRGLFPTATLVVLLCVALGVQAVVELVVRRELPSPFLNFSWEQVRLGCGAFATLLALSYLVQSRGGADLGAGYYVLAAAAVGLLAGGILSRRAELAREPARTRRVEAETDVEPVRTVADDGWLDDPELLALLADDGDTPATPPVPITALAPAPQPVAAAEPERDVEPEPDPEAAVEPAVAAAPDPTPQPEPARAREPEAEPAPEPATAAVAAPEPEPEPTPEPAPEPVEVTREPEPEPVPAAPSVSLVVVPANGSSNGKADSTRKSPATRKATASRKSTAARKATASRKTTATRKATGKATGKTAGGTRKATGTRTPTRNRRRSPGASDRQNREEPDDDAHAEQRDPDPAQDDAGNRHAAPGDGAV